MHRAELKELVESWVNPSGYLKKPVSYPAARSMLNKQAKSMGNAGVSTINHYPDCDFERGKKFLKQKIAILNNTAAIKNNAPECEMDAYRKYKRDAKVLESVKKSGGVIW